MASPLTPTARKLYAKAMRAFLARENPSLFIDLMRAQGHTRREASRSLTFHRTTEAPTFRLEPCGDTEARTRTDHRLVQAVLRTRMEIVGVDSLEEGG